VSRTSSYRFCVNASNFAAIAGASACPRLLAGTLRFSHYDQVVQAAIDGSGVAIGRNPHNARHLREGQLVAPLGNEAMLSWGTYFVLIALRSAERPVVKEFVAWLRDEIRQDAAADAERKGSDRRRLVRPAAPTRTRGS